jgi:hypothetical protein
MPLDVALPTPPSQTRGRRETYCPVVMVASSGTLYTRYIRFGVSQTSAQIETGDPHGAAWPPNGLPGP